LLHQFHLGEDKRMEEAEDEAEDEESGQDAKAN